MVAKFRPGASPLPACRPDQAVHRIRHRPTDRGSAMPIKLIPPRKGKSPYWTIRGTYLGYYVDRSTGASKRAVARQGQIQGHGSGKSNVVEFPMRRRADVRERSRSLHEGGRGEHGSSRGYWSISVKRHSDRIDQAAIDAAAATRLYPNASGGDSEPTRLCPRSARLLRRARRRTSISTPSRLWRKQERQLGSGPSKPKPSSRKRKRSTRSSPRS
jgi:hypothetical protein